MVKVPKKKNGTNLANGAKMAKQHKSKPYVSRGRRRVAAVSFDITSLPAPTGDAVSCIAFPIRSDPHGPDGAFCIRLATGQQRRSARVYRARVESQLSDVGLARSAASQPGAGVMKLTRLILIAAPMVLIGAAGLVLAETGTIISPEQVPAPVA